MIVYMREINIDFRKQELENNLLLPKKSITTAKMHAVPGKRENGYIEFNVKMSLDEYNQLSKRNISMLNAYKYRKR